MASVKAGYSAARVPRRLTQRGSERQRGLSRQASQPCSFIALYDIHAYTAWRRYLHCSLYTHAQTLSQLGHLTVRDETLADGWAPTVPWTGGAGRPPAAAAHPVWFARALKVTQSLTVASASEPDSSAAEVPWHRRSTADTGVSWRQLKRWSSLRGVSTSNKTESESFPRQG